MSFASPVWLLALLAVPAGILAYQRARRRTRRYAIRFTAVASARAAVGASPSWQRHLPAALLLAATAALALALARPQTHYQAAVNEASMMLVTDHSGSMAATDVSPTRLQAAESAADTFISKLPSGIRVGAVAFSSSPDASQAPVADKSAAKAIIDGQQADGSTATGDALLLALQLLHADDRKHPPSAIVLLSDGSANAGVDSVQVATQAGRDRIPVYTVALGTPGGTLANPDPFGAPVPVPPDPELLARIAGASHGRAFTAQTADQLSSIYKGLASQLGSVTRTREVTVDFAIAGLALLLAAGGLAVRRSGRLP